MSCSNDITYLSLFAGCGGFDIGFKENNFKCLGAYDNDPYVTDVYLKNLNGPAYIHDLNDLNLPGFLPEKIDVVIAGSPCQGFSTIGKRKVNDPRNHLLLTGGQIAVKYDAKVFVSENVLGSNSGEHKRYWIKLQKFLTQNNYQTKLLKYNASDFGLPQLRKRLILYAWKSDLIQDIDFLLPTVQKVLLNDIFKDMNDLKNHNLNFIENGTDLTIANRIKQGQKLCNVRGGERSVHTWQIPEVFGKITKKEEELLTLIMKLRRQLRRRENGDADPVEKKVLKRYFDGETELLLKSLLNKGYIKELDKNYIDLKNTFNGKYKRLDMSSLSPTVDTRFGSYKNFIHPTEHRSISVREAARIQGFKDTFVFYGPVHKQYEMVGNAVPPPLSHFIAKNVKEKLIPIVI
ncbi:MAG: DNA cytosine methyltransferase [bacterium]